MSRGTRPLAAATAALAILLAGVLEGLSSPADAEVGEEVGYVVGFRGEAADLEWHRGTRRLRIETAPLREGDVLRVLRPGASLTVFFDMQERVVTSEDGVVEVTSRAAPPTVSGSLLRLLRATLQPGDPGPPSIPMVPLRSRGDEEVAAPPFRVALLEGRPLRLQPGRRSLRVGWTGGDGRAVLRLTRETCAGARVSEAEGGPQEGRLDVDLAPGRYCLAVEDETGRGWAPIEVTPAAPCSRALAGDREATRRALDAVALARCEGGAWLLESYALFAALADQGYAEAGALRDRLAAEGRAALAETAGAAQPGGGDSRVGRAPVGDAARRGGAAPAESD